MKHTKGPWAVGKQPMNIVNDVCVVAEANPLISEFQANASLIAAAPELLAAAKEVANFLKGTQDEAEDARLQLLLEAITKAEGK